MPRLDTHSRSLLFSARDCVARARADSQRPNALTADSVIAIVMAAASAEAFVNEFPEYVLIHRDVRPEEPDHMLPRIIGCAEALREMEESRASVTSKYLIASLALAGRSFNTGAAPFQDFKALVDLRNAIMHVKPAWNDDGHLGRRVVDALAQRGIAMTGEGDGSLPWLDRLKTPPVAKWAHDSALAMIQAFWTIVPVRDHYDPLDFQRHLWRDYPKL